MDMDIWTPESFRKFKHLWVVVSYRQQIKMFLLVSQQLLHLSGCASSLSTISFIMVWYEASILGMLYSLSCTTLVILCLLCFSTWIWSTIGDSTMVAVLAQPFTRIIIFRRKYVNTSSIIAGKCGDTESTLCTEILKGLSYFSLTRDLHIEFIGISFND